MGFQYTSITVHGFPNAEHARTAEIDIRRTIIKAFSTRDGRRNFPSVRIGNHCNDLAAEITEASVLIRPYLDASTVRALFEETGLLQHLFDDHGLHEGFRIRILSHNNPRSALCESPYPHPNSVHSDRPPRHTPHHADRLTPLNRGHFVSTRSTQY